MTEPRALPDRKLRILHVLQTTHEDSLRRVASLARRQAALGHAVGLALATSEVPEIQTVLADLEPHLDLGIHRRPTTRGPRMSDIVAAFEVERHGRRLAVDVVHGHGGKGGFYARAAGLLGRRGTIRCYTPFDETREERGAGLRTLGAACERVLARVTDLMLFESVFLANRFRRRVGEGRAMVAIVPDGIGPDQRTRVTADAGAADLLYVGGLRADDGLDTLIDALAILQRRHGRPFKLALVGTGPHRAALDVRAETRGVAECLRVLDPIPAQHAFALGRILVAPARADRLPQVVIEAAAAHVPMVAFDVGGIGEVFGPYRDRLVAPGDPIALAKALERILDAESTDVATQAAGLAAHVGARFAIEGTTRAVIAGYRDAIARRALASATIEQTAPAPT